MARSPLPIFLALVFAPLLGCAARSSSATSTATSTSQKNAEKHVYRLDFVLTANDAGGAASTTSFTLNLPENDKGEMNVGRNAALVTGHPVGPGGAPLSGPRYDVGMKITARVQPSGDNLLIDVSTEMSSIDAPTDIRKLASRGSALALAGKPALVNTLEDDRRRYQLTVTATKLQ